MGIGVDASSDPLCGDGLAQVVGQGRQHKGKGPPRPAPQGRRLVQHQHGVVPHVALLMKARLLRNADQGLHLRKPRGQLSHVPQRLKKQRGAIRLQKRLAQLPLHPLRRQGGQVDIPAQSHGFRGHGEPEPGRELGSPQHPQRVLRKRPAVHMAQNTPAQIVQSVEVVQYLPRQHVFHQSVHGEIPPPGGLLRAQKRVHADLEIPVAPACGPLPPGHGNVQAIALQAVNTEAGPHLQAAPHTVQYLRQLPGGDAVDLNVHVGVLPAQQPVPDEAAHIVCRAPQGRRLPGNGPGGLHIPGRGPPACHARRRASR